MKTLLLSAVVIIVTSTSVFGETPCPDPVLFVEHGYGVVHSYCQQPTYQEAMARLRESQKKKLFEPLTRTEMSYFTPTFEVEVVFQKPEPSNDVYEARLKKDVDYYESHDDRHRIGKPRPPRSYDPERWDYIRFVDNSQRDGWGFLLFGGQRSTGLNMRERVIASRIRGETFSNNHYELLAGRFSYRWGGKRKVR